MSGDVTFFLRNRSGSRCQKVGFLRPSKLKLELRRHSGLVKEGAKLPCDGGTGQRCGDPSGYLIENPEAPGHRNRVGICVR